jgi:hypothetical protein
MFLAFDESERCSKNIFGGILLPEQELPDLEKEWTILRLKHKLFAEIKWSSIDQYYKRYCDFLDLFFSKKHITFHSICYRRTNQKYNAVYVLIRTITWKMQNAGLNEPLFILFDNDGSIGEKETLEIKKIAKVDGAFKQKVEFCNQGTSHILGILQLADVLVGSICSKVNSELVNKEREFIVKYIESKNKLPLDWSSERLPKLYEYKIHYFDPDRKIKK